MIPLRQRNVIRKRIHFRIRQKMEGTTARPRLNVYRSLNHIYAQVIDDGKGETLLSASTLAAKVKTGGNVAAAREVGKAGGRAGSGKGNQAGRVRPRRLSVSRAHQGPGGCSTRSWFGVLGLGSTAQAVQKEKTKAWQH